MAALHDDKPQNIIKEFDNKYDKWISDAINFYQLMSTKYVQMIISKLELENITCIPALGARKQSCVLVNNREVVFFFLKKKQTNFGKVI